MYHKLPTEIRIQVLKFLNQRAVAKLFLAYDKIDPAPEELVLMSTLFKNKLKYLADCYDLVWNVNIVSNQYVSFWPVLDWPFQDEIKGYTKYVEKVCFKGEFHQISSKPLVSCDCDLSEISKIGIDFHGQIHKLLIHFRENRCRSPIAVESFYNIISKHKVKDLEISYRTITANELVHAIQTIPVYFSRLSLVCLHWSDLEVASIIKALRECKVPLDYLSITEQKFGKETIIELCEWLVSTTALVSLSIDLREFLICNEYLFLTTLVGRRNSLKELKLKDVNQNNRVIGLLVELLDPKVSKIETLDIDEFYGSEEIFTAPNRLKSLRLVSDFVRFEPSCFSALGTSRLERLEFRNSVFTEDQVSEIFKMLPRSSIIDFTLFRCELTSRNWSEFVNALKNCDRFMKSISISAPRTGCNLVELVTAVNQKRYAIAEFMLCIDRIRDAIPILKPLCQYPRKIGRLVLKNHHWDKIEV